MENLPQTFEDAIIFARLLNTQYLCIDCLIIQDSVDDWRRESTNMGRIYLNFICNIAGGADAHCQADLFPRESGASKVCKVEDVRIASLQGSSYLDIPRDYAAFSVQNSLLRHRGWGFQERLLAARRLSLQPVKCSGSVHTSALLRRFQMNTVIGLKTKNCGTVNSQRPIKIKFLSAKSRIHETRLTSTRLDRGYINHPTILPPGATR